MENKISLPNKLAAKHYLLLFILIASVFLRLYNLANTVQFLGDQGRDAMVVANIFRNWDPVFIGPVTSVGNMYLGPLYYYFMLPFLMLTYPSPMGPVYAIALLGILTVLLVYRIGKLFLSEKTALWASTLFGFSAVVAHNTRFSWNPNPAPFVSLFMLLFVYWSLKKNVWYWVAVTTCFSILIQLHYLTLLSGAGFGFLWIYQLVGKIRKKQSIKKMLVATGVSFLVFLVSLTPLILFDMKHDGLNRKAFFEIFTEEDAFTKEGVQGSNSLSQYVVDIVDRSELILSDIVIGHHSNNINFFVTFFVLCIFSIAVANQYKMKKDITGEIILLAFLVTGIIGTAFYKQNIYEHYIAYLFPVTYLVLGKVFDFLQSKKIFGLVIIGVYLLMFAKFNFNHAKVILKSLGWTIAHIQAVSKTIEDRVNVGEKYNIVLLNSTGDLLGQNYRYFLSTSSKPPILEDQVGNVDTLFIIDEERKIENEVTLPVYEIVIFPEKVPVEVYTIPNGPEITVLRKSYN